MEHDKVAALRRVAIVLSSLPDETVARLVMGLASDQQRAVRMAISDLSDIDPLERRRALDAFATSLRRGRSSLAGHNDAAEIVLSKTALQHTEGRTPWPQYHPGDPPVAAMEPPFDFLSDVDDDVLAAQVRDEHPQTIAIILASIAPSQAARILPKLSPATRSEALRRLGKLDAPSPEVVDDIGSQLKHKLIESGTRFAASHPRGPGADSPHSTAGQAALRAILAAMSAPDSHATPSSPHTPSTHVTSVYRNESSTHTPQAVGAPTHNAADNDASGGMPVDPPPAGSSTTSSPEESTDAVHARLVAMTPEQLREALASVPTRQSLLALCGLPRGTADKVLASLPRRQARQIRQQLTEVGTLELREIDRAKEAVARAADKLTQSPKNQFATAKFAGAA